MENPSSNGSQGSSSGSLSVGNISKITNAEREVLDLLTNELLTIKKIAIRRQTSIRNIQKIARKLREKGFLKKGSHEVRLLNGYNEPSGEGIRINGEQWNIKILDQSEKYKSKVGLSIIEDGNTIRCHREVIDIYSTKSFFGSDTWAATAKSIDYWNTFFVRLENELKVILVKPRVQNIERVKAEYAHIRNGLAIKCEREGDKIKIRTREDGKVWFLIDNSFNLKEAEAVHPQTAEKDMGSIVEPFFNDLRDNRPILPSEAWKLNAETMKMIHELAYNQKFVMEIMKSQMHHPIEEQKPIPKEQKSMTDYIG